MIKQMFEGGSMPVLERLIQFTSARHSVLVDAVANLSTPNYQPRDLDPKGFQAALASAIDARRASPDAAGPLHFADTEQLAFKPNGIHATPQASNAGVMFHDMNNRDLDRIMSSLAENQLAHRAGVELLRNEMMNLQTAIRGRL